MDHELGLADTGPVSALDDPSLRQIVSQLRGELSYINADDSKYAHTRRQLTQALMDLFDKTKDESVIDDIIALQSDSLATYSELNPDRWMCHHVLSVTLGERFRRTHNNALVEEAVVNGRLAHKACPDDSSSKRVVCTNLIGQLQARDALTTETDTLDEQSALLAEVFWALHVEDPNCQLPASAMAYAYEERYKMTRDSTLLDTLIPLQREALRTNYPIGHPERRHWCEPLARSLLAQWERTGELALLEEGLALYREIVVLCPREHPDRAQHCQSLVAMLVRQFECTGNPESLDEAISVTRDLLSDHPQAHATHFKTLEILAGFLWKCFERTDDDTLLDEVLAIRRQAFALCPDEDPDQARLAAHLAVALVEKSRRGNDLTLLDEAISLERRGVEMSRSNPEARASRLGNLAIRLHMRYVRMGDTTDLDEAVDIARGAYISCPTEATDSRAWLAQQLAYIIGAQYNSSGDQASLAEAIQLAMDAVGHTVGPPSSGDERHIAACDTLAQLLTQLSMARRRHIDTSLLNHLRTEDACRDAVRYQRMVLAVRPLGTALGASSCHNLVVALTEFFHATHDIAHLDEAVSLQEQAVASVHAGEFDHGSYLATLAEVLYLQYEHAGDPATFARAVQVMNEAPDVTPRTHPRYWQRCTVLAQTIINTTHSASCHVEHRVGVREALQNLQDAMRTGAEVGDAFDLAVNVAHILARVDIAQTEHDVLLLLLDVYGHLIRLIPVVSNFALDGRQRLRRTAALVTARGAESQAFACAVRVGHIQSGLELLEQARGLFWAQTLRFRDAHSYDLPPEVAQELDGLLKELVHVRGTSEGLAGDAAVERDRRHRYDHRMKRLLRTVRALPDHQGFMYGPHWSAIAAVATPRNPIVVLVAAVDGAHAAILDGSSTGPVYVSLGSITLKGLASMDAGVRGVQTRSDAPAQADGNTDPERAMHVSKKRADPATDTYWVLAQIWRDIVKPVMQALGFDKLGPQAANRPRLHWCPTGQFTFIPLHAGGIYKGEDRECCSDYVVSSYTPTVSALIRARAVPIQLLRAEFNVLLVAEGQAPSMPRLPLVEEEIKGISALATASGVRVAELGRGPTTSQVVEALPDTPMIHLACHGVQNGTDVLDSGFCLRDGRLTIARLMELELGHASLAFLSACETAKGDARQPDQIVHLAAAMLFAGFRSIVATMWNMNDADGPAVARDFYAALFAKERLDANAVPFALDAAVYALRERGVPPHRWATFIHMGA